MLDGVIGGQWFMHGICQSMPDKEYRGVSELVEALYVRMVESTDWNRVILEASTRHLALDHDPPEDRGVRLFAVEGICGECLNEALLAVSFGGKFDTDWKREPISPRELPGSHPLPPGAGAQEKPSDEAQEAAIALAKALGYTGKSYEDEE
jgi:hypothetical protein